YRILFLSSSVRKKTNRSRRVTIKIRHSITGQRARSAPSPSAPPSGPVLLHSAALAPCPWFSLSGPNSLTLPALSFHSSPAAALSHSSHRASHHAPRCLP